MTNAIRIPRAFMIDHDERDCASPEIVKTTKAHYWISAEPTAGLADLLSDAELYEDSSHYEREYFGLCMSARATANAIRKALTPEALQAVRAISFG